MLQHDNTCNNSKNINYSFSFFKNQHINSKHYNNDEVKHKMKLHHTANILRRRNGKTLSYTTNIFKKLTKNKPTKNKQNKIRTTKTPKCRSFWIGSVSFEHFPMAVESWEPSFYIPQMLLFCCNKTAATALETTKTTTPPTTNSKQQMNQPAI